MPLRTVIEPQTSQAGASLLKCANWALNCSKTFTSESNGPDASATGDPTKAPIRLAGLVNLFTKAGEDCLVTWSEAEISSFWLTAVPALILTRAFVSAIFCARSLVFSTNSLAVVVFLLTFGAGLAALLGVF